MNKFSTFYAAYYEGKPPKPHLGGIQAKAFQSANHDWVVHYWHDANATLMGRLVARNEWQAKELVKVFNTIGFVPEEAWL